MTIDAVSRDNRYITYAKWPYNMACIRCPETWLDGTHKHIEQVLCTKCMRWLHDNPQTMRQRLEAESNEAIQLVYKRMMQ